MTSKKRLMKLKQKLLVLSDTKHSIQDAANIVGINKSNLYRAFKKLREMKLITEKRKLTQAGFLFLKMPLMGYEKTHQIRLHNLLFKVKILSGKKTVFNQMEQIFKVRTWQINNNKIREFQLDDTVIRFISENVLIYPPEVIANTAEIAKEQVMEIIWDIISKLEKKLSIKLSNTPYMVVRVGSQHIAIINDEIAEAFLKGVPKVPLEIQDSEGNVRIIIDNSKQLKELEFIHHFYAEEDSKKYKDMLADIIINDEWRKIKERLTKLEKYIEGKWQSYVG